MTDLAWNSASSTTYSETVAAIKGENKARTEMDNDRGKMEDDGKILTDTNEISLVEHYDKNWKSVESIEADQEVKNFRFSRPG